MNVSLKKTLSSIRKDPLKIEKSCTTCENYKIEFQTKEVTDNQKPIQTYIGDKVKVDIKVKYKHLHTCSEDLLSHSIDPGKRWIEWYFQYKQPLFNSIITHGLFILGPWFNHQIDGESMDKPWTNHGQTMDKPWTNHGQTMDKPWTKCL
ncbi:hypothetical protein K4L44_04465 [Halosquirtibacter laminarini]|uniref:Uncharacterized protein n=1 Tax=Halosquirtibacter laminarini TaxID=3374600 RepID=A0AC61NQ30_9BACT|nr:hypothetical protein K4L44_04465 [Prolixibacteraceae bacterium]